MSDPVVLAKSDRTENNVISSTISALPPLVQPFAKYLTTPSGLVLIACCILLLLMKQDNKKTTLASGRWANEREIKAARKLACQQIEHQTQEKFALYIGTPRGSKIVIEPDGRKILCLPEDPRTIYVPNAQENIINIGRSGSGKTFSALRRLEMSAIQQGFTLYCYDFKGHEDPAPSSELVDFAYKHGYKVSILGVGYPETHCCNLLDFIDNELDSENALEIASAINANLKLSGGGGSSSFFSETGNQLVQAVMMLAKGSSYPDIAMCHKILSLPNFVKRLRNARLNQYQKIAFDTFLASAGSPETAASIASTASIMFSRFASPQILRTFGGQSTLPLDVDGRHLIIFKVNPKQRNTVLPLNATAMQMHISRNVYRPRKVPLVFSGDEINTTYLKPLVDWVNQNRSSKFCASLGVQSLGFFEEVYGEKMVQGIIGGCTTQIIFQLNDKKTADYFSSILGDREIEFVQKSKSTSQGKTTRSRTPQIQIRPLMEGSQLGKIKRGRAVMINSGQENETESRIPMRVNFQIPQRDIDAMKEGKKMWSTHREAMTSRNNIKPFTERDWLEREKAANKLLPDPDAQELASIF